MYSGASEGKTTWGLNSKSMEPFQMGLHPFCTLLRNSLDKRWGRTLIHAVYFPQTVCNLFIKIGGVYENKGQCKMPTSVLVLDMSQSNTFFGMN